MRIEFREISIQRMRSTVVPVVMLIGMLACTRSTAPAADPKKNESPTSIATRELNRRYQLVGALNRPLGKLVTIQGVVVMGPSKGYDGGPNIRVQRVDGRATQEDIQLQLLTELSKFSEPSIRTRGGYQPKSNDSVELVGFENGAFTGIPIEVQEHSNMNVQASGHYFRTWFDAVECRKIDPIEFAPAEFVDRSALLQGRAKSDAKTALIIGKDWQLLVDEQSAWPTDHEGKLVESLGVVRRVYGTTVFRMEKATSRLVRLEDQVGRKVALRGIAWSMNGNWWFNYRGVEIQVENMEKLVRGEYDYHGQPILIMGVLRKDPLPGSKADKEMSKPTKKKSYNVRDATCEMIDSLLSPERASEDD